MRNDLWFEKFVDISGDKKVSFINKKINIKIIEKKVNFENFIKTKFYRVFTIRVKIFKRYF